MTRNMLKSKIHRATVTDADLNYDGSITVDAGLMEAANMLPHELVHVWNVNNGERFETYVIPGTRQSGTICVNGSAARRVHRGDLLIIASFTWLAEEEARRHEPAVVLVDEQNRIRTRNGVSVEAA
jgi:aspartate 1-decarboxylase